MSKLDITNIVEETYPISSKDENREFMMQQRRAFEKGVRWAEEQIFDRKSILEIEEIEKEFISKRRELQIELIKEISVEVSDYFEKNEVEHRKIKTFSIQGNSFGYYHINTTPDFDEEYCGGNDEAIQLIGEKYGVRLKFPSYYYIK